jgi:hypothetical protein
LGKGNSKGETETIPTPDARHQHNWAIPTSTPTPVNAISVRASTHKRGRNPLTEMNKAKGQQEMIPKHMVE